jgi:hypothetical protein
MESRTYHAAVTCFFQNRLQRKLYRQWKRGGNNKQEKTEFEEFHNVL